MGVNQNIPSAASDAEPRSSSGSCDQPRSASGSSAAQSPIVPVAPSSPSPSSSSQPVAPQTQPVPLEPSACSYPSDHRSARDLDPHRTTERLELETPKDQGLESGPEPPV